MTETGNSGEIRERIKRGGRRVVMLSRVDRERLARGEIAVPEEAVHASDARGVKPKHFTKAELAVRAAKLSQVESLSAREKEILAEVPPHFGKI